MDLSSPTPNSPLTPVFGDNVQDLLGAGVLHVNPTGIIVVNSTADTVDDLNSGVTTLRDAILQANADNGEDLIVFDRSLFSSQQTITLSLGELDITHSLDIIAPRDSLTGTNLVEVSGNKTSRVFEIETGATVTLSGLIVTDGQVTDDNGGGIKNSSTLTLDSSIVRGDSAQTSTPDSTAGNGGGIYNNNGILTVTDSTLSGNSAKGGGNINLNTGGGGIYNQSGTVFISNSIISSNLASGSAGNSGGGIFNQNGTVTISNSTINLNGNSSIFNAGGIYNTGTMNVSNSTINDNSAGERSGGIENTGILTVSNSTISNNSAGVSFGGIENTGILTVSNSTISGNSALQGGGISNVGTGTGNIDNSTISGNSAVGGGIFNVGTGGTVNINNSTISGNRGNGGRYSGGGGIDNGGALNVSDSTISNNSAPFGNGGGIENSGILTLVFSTVTQNLAGNGGGLYGGSVMVRNTIIASNLNSANGVNPDVSGTLFTSLGYNLIGDSTGSTGFGATGDIVGTGDNPIDPRLAPLDFYGGPTQTIALLPDSPAIDAGDPTVLATDPTTDQRGFPRVSNGRADIGAFEVQV